MLSKEEQFNRVCDWSIKRLDHMYIRSPLNALALEEEFFEWYDDRHKNRLTDVLFVPYHESID